MLWLWRAAKMVLLLAPPQLKGSTAWASPRKVQQLRLPLKIWNKAKPFFQAKKWINSMWEEIFCTGYHLNFLRHWLGGLFCILNHWPESKYSAQSCSTSLFSTVVLLPMFCNFCLWSSRFLQCILLEFGIIFMRKHAPCTQKSVCTGGVPCCGARLCAVLFIGCY